MDSMAMDLDVVASARVSTSHDPWEASKGNEADDKLIRYLMTHGHGSPFEHAVFRFYVKAPIFVVREWQRHRIASYNEVSGRYSEFQPEFYIPTHARMQDRVNKQGSHDALDQIVDVSMATHLATTQADAFKRYTEMLEMGIAREIARLVLPLTLYTKFWWTVNARSLMNFLALRNHDAAQWEIRQYAIAIEEDFKQIMPVTWQAWNDNGRVAP